MSTPSPTPASSDAALAIVCGAGSLPYAVADAVIGRGRRVMLFPLRGWADAQAVQRYPHRWLALGRFGEALRELQTHGCRDIVFIGQLVRPALRDLRFDWTTLRLLPRLVQAFRGGDDHLLSRAGKFFEERGFRVLGAHEVAPEILAAVGPIGACAPAPDDLDDIAHGLAVLRALSPFDIGQGVVVAARHVLAVEAAEGTDAMLDRIADQRRLGRIRAAAGTGVLVKAAKVGQDRRFDLPSIGPRTVERAALAGLAGVAVVAGEAIVAEPARVAAQADREKLFVLGVDGGGTGR
jgi:DUF1009 family protein